MTPAFYFCIIPTSLKKLANRKTREEENDFTLTELMIITAIIGILAMITSLHPLTSCILVAHPYIVVPLNL